MNNVDKFMNSGLFAILLYIRFRTYTGQDEIINRWLANVKDKDVKIKYGKNCEYIENGRDVAIKLDENIDHEGKEDIQVAFVRHLIGEENEFRIGIENPADDVLTRRDWLRA